MKTKYLRVCLLPMMAGGIGVLMSGCVAYPNGSVGFQPVVFAAPEPVVVEAGPVMVPDSYTWDGFEYVGLVGGGYFYLGPGDVWLTCDSGRLERFHGWERGHPDWQEHAIHNDRYRTDAHGHTQPMAHDKPAAHDQPTAHEQQPTAHDKPTGHDQPAAHEKPAAHDKPENGRDESKPHTDEQR